MKEVVLTKFTILFEKIEYFINNINNKLGIFVSYLLIVIMLTSLYEIVCRYFLNKPTVWVWGINTQIFAFIIFLGGSYQLLYRQIIIADIIYDKFSRSGKRVIDVISFLCFIIFFGTLLWEGTYMALRSIMQREYSQEFFKLPLFPIKSMLPIGTILILLQGGINFVHDMIGKNKKGEVDNEH